MLEALLHLSCTFVIGLVCLLATWILWHRWKYCHSTPKERVIAFFHPYCSAGGGGERVLWAIVQALGEIHEKGLAIKVLLYTVDPPDDSYQRDVLEKVKDRFALSIPSSLEITFIHLNDCAHFLGKYSFCFLLLSVFFPNTQKSSYYFLWYTIVSISPRMITITQIEQIIYPY